MSHPTTVTTPASKNLEVRSIFVTFKCEDQGEGELDGGSGAGHSKQSPSAKSRNHFTLNMRFVI